MTAINNFLAFINENWTMITTCATLVVMVGFKVHRWFKLSKEEKVDAALSAVRECMLELVTRAEAAFGSETGELKRAQVLSEVFAKYPILAEFADSETVLETLDVQIDAALDKMRTMLETNESFKKLFVSN